MNKFGGNDMGYGRNKNRDSSYDVEALKDKLSKEMPGVDLDNVDQEDVKEILMNQINNNPNINISQDVRDKINRGDMDGLKNELIKYLDSQNSSDGSSERIKNMLQNNDYEGLKSELMGMLLKGMTGQKKNEVKSQEENRVENVQNTNPLAGIFDEAFINNIMNKLYDENRNDSRIVLLNSIKPFMSDKRQKAIDECVRTINLIAMMEKFGFKVGR